MLTVQALTITLWIFAYCYYGSVNIYEQSFIYSTLVLVPNNTTIPSFDLLVVLGIILVCCQHLFILMMLTIKSYSRWIYLGLRRGPTFLNWDITCSWMQTLGLYQRLLSYSVVQPSATQGCQTETSTLGNWSETRLLRARTKSLTPEPLITHLVFLPV